MDTDPEVYAPIDAYQPDPEHAAFYGMTRRYNVTVLVTYANGRMAAQLVRGVYAKDAWQARTAVHFSPLTMPLRGGLVDYVVEPCNLSAETTFA